MSIPVGAIEGASDVTLTITANGELSTKGIQNGCYRAVRIAGKAAGLDLAGFLTLLEAMTEAARAEKAKRDAKERIDQLLAAVRPGPVAEPQTSAIVTNQSPRSETLP